MTFRGKVQGNVILLKEPTGLPDGTEVSIEPIDATVQPEQPDELAPRDVVAAPLPDLLRKFSGIVESGRADGSHNHDHYIYGSPKR